MFEIYDRVRIKARHITGTIVDVSTIGEKKIYIVECDEENIKDGYGGKWKLFDCNSNEIEKV